MSGSQLGAEDSVEERPQGVSLAYVLASSLAVLLGMVIGGFVSILILMQLLR